MSNLQRGLREGPPKDSVGALMHELAEETDKIITEEKHTQEKMREISWENRELTRTILVSRAQELRREYPTMSIATIRRHLVQMVSVSV